MRRKGMRSREAGFTLVELLVVMAIIGVLVALMLVALSSVREAGRKTSCRNNLKQIGLAVLAYEGAKALLPPGGVTEGPCCNTKSGTNWAIEILPHLEEQALYDKYDHTKFNEDPDNAEVRETAVAHYVCPSDVETDKVDMPESGPGKTVRYRRGSYRASTGLGDGNNDSWVGPHNNGDAFGLSASSRGAMYNIGYVSYGQVAMAHIRDGTGKTLLVGEHATKTHPRRRSFWAYTWAAYSMSEVTPESRILLNDYDRCVAIGGSPHGCKRMWSSMHPGVVQFVMCDGSVQTFNSSIDVNVLGQLATIDGREEVELP
ncbi:MAG: DUF1559 domain-containing protein [Pirellulales bacterium]|nr:DUF1559 domain-containing protein [Pirellulales bacterium]